VRRIFRFWLITVAGWFILGAGFAVYAATLINENQCYAARGAIDYSGRYCMIGATPHLLREGVLRLIPFGIGAALLFTLVALALVALVRRDGC